MIYTLAAHPTKYAGVQFRSRLESRWAAFFDLAGICWEYEPVDLDGWTPDFRAYSDCIACPKSHVYYAEVKPYDSVEQFHDHPAFGAAFGNGVLLLGNGPIPSQTVRVLDCPGAGEKPIEVVLTPAFGIQTAGLVDLRTGAPRLDPSAAWKEAGNLVQWRPANRPALPPRESGEVIDLYLQGKSIRAITHATGQPSSTVSRWVKKAIDAGIVKPRKATFGGARA